MSAEEKIQLADDETDELLSDISDDEAEDLETDEQGQVESSEFALKMINSVKSMNMGEFSHYEMVNSFTLADELKCLYMFIKACHIGRSFQCIQRRHFCFLKALFFQGTLI